jgi:hypothetical protein
VFEWVTENLAVHKNRNQIKKKKATYVEKNNLNN